MRKWILTLCTILILSACSDAQDVGTRESSSGPDQFVPRDLFTEIEAGRVSLMSTRGNGSSSGAAVEGSISNNNDMALRIGVNLARPMYFSNRGRGQNMIAVQVFMGDGRYHSDGENEFLQLPPRVNSHVLFIAFCADFDRENPTAADSFTLATLPAEYTKVVESIRDYILQNPDADITVAGQVAVWLDQGESIESIGERFDFSTEDYRLALSLLQ